ncbi:MAG TPA: AMP-binding protein, partial [Candidatus Binatia bacterium]|nr:AMP-binding protein [Candidatus Binatia bacterium]
MAFLLPQLLTESAERSPDQIAVEDSGGKLTYAEMELLSNQLAHHLRAEGVRPGDRVGLFLDKSIYSVAALFAIQKAGAAYVPVDPHAPPVRAAYILQNCGVRIVANDRSKLRGLPSQFLTGGSLESVLLFDAESSQPRDSWSSRLRSATLEEICASQPATHPGVSITDDYLAYI